MRLWAVQAMDVGRAALDQATLFWFATFSTSLFSVIYFRARNATNPTTARPPMIGSTVDPPPPAHMSGVGCFGISMPPWLMYSATPGTLWVGHLGQPAGPTNPSEQMVPPSCVAWQQTPGGGGCP
jgi:hypothetical protein